jgi:hypothetical protein
VVESYSPDQNPGQLQQRLQGEMQRQYQQMPTKPGLAIAQQLHTYQARLGHIKQILDAAEEKNVPRTALPGRLAQVPLVRSRWIQTSLVKFYNFCFKEQRTTQHGVIQAGRESAKIQADMVQQIAAIEVFQRELHGTITQEVNLLQQQMTDLEARMTQMEQQMQAIEQRTRDVSQHENFGTNHSGSLHRRWSRASDCPADSGASGRRA